EWIKAYVDWATKNLLPALLALAPIVVLALWLKQFRTTAYVAAACALIVVASYVVLGLVFPVALNSGGRTVTPDSKVGSEESPSLPAQRCVGTDRATLTAPDSGLEVSVTIRIEKAPPSGFSYWSMAHTLNANPQGDFPKYRLSEDESKAGRV